MDYYQKYLRLLTNNKIVGGDISNEDKELFYNKDSYMHYPLSWNLQNNQFSRWPIILKLVKLSPNEIKRIINNDNEYNNFLNCIFISIDGYEARLKKNYENEFNKYLTHEYNHPEIKTEPSKIIYIKDLIKYFIDTHNKIKDLLLLSNEQDEETAKNITEHINLCRDLYYSWRKAINSFYGQPLFDGLVARDSKDEKENTANLAARKKVEKTPVVSLFKRLYSVKNEINKAYKNLYELSVTTYLKVRCEGTPAIKDKNGEIITPADPTAYNERYNVYLEPEAENIRLPRSMYLTGPNPNERLEYYGVQFNGGQFDRVPKDHPTLVTNAERRVIGVGKYDYGMLYGPFTRIFTPQESNKEVANKCYEILEKFRENKPVFVLGYGASGAGKTSTLIAFKKGKTEDERNGVLLQLLKSKDFEIYNEINVSIHELYSTADDGRGEVRKYDDIIFEKDRSTNEFYLSSKNVNGQKREGIYTENVRTPVDPETIKAKEAEIENLFEKAKRYDESKDARSKEEFLLAYDNFYGGKSDRFAAVPIFNEPARQSALRNINDISWITTKYMWEIKNIGEGMHNIYFTGKNSKKENLDVTDQVKDAEKYKNFDSMQEIYDPRLLCRKDEKAEKAAKEKGEPYKGECDNDTDYGKKPIKINELGDFVLTLVDRIRMVNPTTNNPQSSRSHLLIYIKVPVLVNGQVPSNPTNYKYLVFGDLAGVENRFSCGSKDTQTQFLNLFKVDRITGEQDTLNKEPHYTRNTKLKFLQLDDNDPEIKNILDFIGYDIKNKTHGSNEGARVRELEWATGKFARFEGDFRKKKARDDFSQNTNPKYKVLADYIMNQTLKDNDNFDTVPNGGNLFVQFYREKCVAEGLLSSFDPTSDEFIDLVFNSVYKPNTNNDPKFRSLGIIQIIAANEKIFKESDVEALCTERMNEGQFINNALIGMAENISQLVQKANSNSDGGLFKNIPLVKSPCFDHFCNQDHENCFVQIKYDTKGDSSIFNDIQSVINSVNPNNSDNLAIVIFAVLNINRGANDPPKMPYIDTNRLKQIRDEFLTYKYYNQDNITVNKENIKERLKKLIDLIFVGKDGSLEKQAIPGSIFDILNIFKPNMGETMYQAPIKAYKAIDPTKNTFLTNLVSLIKALDIVNSLSVIGTMNFLNEVKNVYTTDNTCSIIKDSDEIIPKTDEPILLYKNIMTDEILTKVITKHKAYKENKTWQEQNVSVEYNETKVHPAYKGETFNTPVVAPIKAAVPVQKAVVPVPVPVQKAVVPVQKTPVPVQKTPVPEQKTPVLAPKASVPTPKASTSTTQSQTPIPFPFPNPLPKGWTTKTEGGKSWYVGPDGKATYTLTLPTGWSTGSDEKETWYVAPNGTTHWRPVWEPEQWDLAKNENGGVAPGWSPPGKVAQQIANIENKVKKLDSIDAILGGYINDKSVMVNNKSELVSEYKQLKKMYKRMKNKII
jgi:hypothetical protein